MIVVNLRQSMRRLLENVKLGIDNDVLLQQIKHDTTSDWAGISAESLYAHGGENSNDYLLGVYGNQIVSAYYITGWHNVTGGRVRFEVAPGVELAGAIGEPVPGGPWKRGEARPVRYFDTSTFIANLDARGVLDTYDGDDDAIDRRMVEVVRDLAKPAATVPTLDGVQVESDPRGGVRVTVPMGTKVTVVQRPL